MKKKLKKVGSKNDKLKNKNPKENEREERIKQQLRWIVYTAVLMMIGLSIFKYLPMYLFGKNILYDASYHVTFVILMLYILWFFIDQEKSWRVPYFIFAGALIIIVSIQRIIANKHDEIGIILALIIGGFSIVIPRWKEFIGKINF